MKKGKAKRLDDDPGPDLTSNSTLDQCKGPIKKQKGILIIIAI